MSTDIPAFAERTMELNIILEAAYKLSKKRTKKSIQKTPLEILDWTDKHAQIFESIKDSLRDAIQLSHPKDNHTI